MIYHQESQKIVNCGKTESVYLIKPHCRILTSMEIKKRQEKAITIKNIFDEPAVTKINILKGGTIPGKSCSDCYNFENIWSKPHNLKSMLSSLGGKSINITTLGQHDNVWL